PNYVFSTNQRFNMIPLRICTISMVLGTVTLMSAGCATYKTISAVKYGNSSPRIYSGTRLNIYAISNNRSALNMFDVEPPEYPMLDLPASFAFDTLILPITVSSAITEQLGL
ncbi:MAG: YceK/YidQ family lipoprotein, partial [Nitrosomonas sp.]|nr:YceK/YidQ family lipoprotein [Nitrosomonas sp.]